MEQESQGMATEKRSFHSTTAINNEKRQEQHRIHQFFSSLLAQGNR
jgi:hypothetical protein